MNGINIVLFVTKFLIGELESAVNQQGEDPYVLNILPNISQVFTSIA